MNRSIVDKFVSIFGIAVKLLSLNDVPVVLPVRVELLLNVMWCSLASLSTVGTTRDHHSAFSFLVNFSCEGMLSMIIGNLLKSVALLCIRQLCLAKIL